MGKKNYFVPLGTHNGLAVKAQFGLITLKLLIIKFISKFQSEDLELSYHFPFLALHWANIGHGIGAMHLNFVSEFARLQLIWLWL